MPKPCGILPQSIRKQTKENYRLIPEYPNNYYKLQTTVPRNSSKQYYCSTKFT